ncbi:MAG: hypothetical protein AVDCRST_MAG44-1262 [uncultured Sphingomonas sp.]|uniref:HTH arsR-type domain-containing protein n=1 Tax=uncultured Sphingomonas sp. TaxID=158754 RepID=A0A6J4SYX0_9SPHN|nr:MAG: hypothetical protein AVDCRST_MAG44-1262 [uncultured Sphingomonas sp.]
MVKTLAALSSPHRLRIMAALIRNGRQYVSELARAVGMSRPLLYLHLEKLEGAGLVEGELSLSADGKALKWFEARDFELILTPETIAAAADLVNTKDNDC